MTPLVALVRSRTAARLAGPVAGLLGLLLALPLLAILGMLGTAPQFAAGDAGDVACALSPDGRDGIPGELVPIYARAAADYGLGGRGAVVLAAINKIETDFGRNLGPSSAGAVGWMQFMPATWASYGVDGDGDGTRNPNDADDAIPAAARYLRAGGAPADWYGAVFAYNHADWYVRDVLALADRYQGACSTVGDPEAERGGGRLIWPTAVHTITAPFGELRPGHRHAGIDIGAPAGAPIMAAAAGVVVLVQGTAESGGYGNYVCLQHSARLRTCYAHLVVVFVRRGDAVSQAQVIGACGDTGHAFGPHLHFEVRVAPAWTPTDPARYLEASPGLVALTERKRRLGRMLRRTGLSRRRPRVRVPSLLLRGGPLRAAPARMGRVYRIASVVPRRWRHPLIGTAERGRFGEVSSLTPLTRDAS
ncbi:MAG TPA: peptidoglycan DD-metalloendopeptidase family protein [Conexibacter sp.]